MLVHRMAIYGDRRDSGGVRAGGQREGSITKSTMVFSADEICDVGKETGSPIDRQMPDKSPNAPNPSFDGREVNS
jgi:hypothetical protein